MSRIVEQKEPANIEPQVAVFYEALGLLNSKLVKIVLRDPKKLAEVTKFILDIQFSLFEESPCDSNQTMDPVTGVCVLKPGGGLIGSQILPGTI
jgi:hypothetical protein